MEEILAERGLDVSYETVRRWVLRFGPAFARNLRRLRPRPADTKHLDEVVVLIQGRRMYLWRAVDRAGEILDILVQSRRNKAAARKLVGKRLRKQSFAPSVLVTDKLPSYGAARREVALSAHNEQGLRKNICAENSYQWCDDVNGCCRTSIRSAQPIASSASIPPFTTSSTSGII